jgi:coenzyme F420-0:L-glutamate ligase / coenzyme F420-1:gamma-L-glutamate ligase
VRPGDDLAALLPPLASDEIVVISHKVVSKAEGRIADLASVEPSDEARALGKDDPRLAQVILDESAAIVAARDGVVICETRHGFVCANAGVDQSNASAEGGELVLLPDDPDGSAASLRSGIEAARGVRPAVVIADSFGRAWRLGQTDVAIGAAGLTALDQWIGRGDGFGRELVVTSIAVADSIAAAADLARAKDSLEPVVLVRGLERFVTPDDGPGAAALRRPPEQDLFR